MPDMWDMSAGEVTRLGLRDAVAEALRVADTHGIGHDKVLSSPERFLAFVEDLTGGESEEMALLRYGLDDETLEPYRKALAMANPTPNDLVRAAGKARMHLVDQRKQQERLSRSATEDIGWGIADFLGLSMPPQSPKGEVADEFRGPGRSAGSNGTQIVDSYGTGTPMGSGSQGGYAPRPQGTSSSGYGTSGANVYRPGTSTGQRQNTASQARPAPSPYGSQQAQRSMQQGRRRGNGLVVALSVVLLVAAVAVAALLLVPRTITFDGNGATSGSMDSLRVRVGETVVLPEVGFSKEGYNFYAWRINGSEDNVVGDAGSIQVPLLGSIELEASWEPMADLQKYVTNELLAGPQLTTSGDYAWVIKYTNTGEVTADVKVNAVAMDSSDNELGDGTSRTFYGLASGESSIMVVLTSAKATKIASQVSAKASPCQSLEHLLRVSEAKRDGDYLVVKVTNEGKVKGIGIQVVAFVKDDDLFSFYAKPLDESGDSSIEPGETVTVKIEETAGWDADQFSFYFYGRAE